MRGHLRRLLRNESGQGMSEYLIIVALIAVASIGVVTVFGRDLREIFGGTTSSLAGERGTNRAVRATVKKKTLKDFGEFSDKGD